MFLTPSAKVIKVFTFTKVQKPTMFVLGRHLELLRDEKLLRP
jgi:hypothetical protein